jgi:hypothetical protein
VRTGFATPRRKIVAINHRDASGFISRLQNAFVPPPGVDPVRNTL